MFFAISRDFLPAAEAEAAGIICSHLHAVRQVFIPSSPGLRRHDARVVQEHLHRDNANAGHQHFHSPRPGHLQILVQNEGADGLSGRLLCEERSGARETIRAAGVGVRCTVGIFSKVFCEPVTLPIAPPPLSGTCLIKDESNDQCSSYTPPGRFFGLQAVIST